MTFIQSQSTLQALLAAARALSESDARQHSATTAALVETLTAALDALAAAPRFAWTGEAAIRAISDMAPEEWLWAFDDTDVARASRPELLELLARAPNPAAAGYLAAVLVHRNFH